MDHLENILEKTGRILTEQYGIRIVCQGNRCCTDNRTIYLPALPDDLPEELWRTIRGYIDHEGAHHIFRSNFAVGNEFRRKHGSDAFGMLNILEDLRVERAMAERFPGSRANLDHAYTAAEKSASEKTEIGEAVPFMRQLAFAVTARAQGRPTPSFVDPPVAALTGLIEREIMASITAPNTKTVAQLAESAWETVKSYLPPPDPPISGINPMDTNNASSSGSGLASDPADDHEAAGAPDNTAGRPKRRRQNQNAVSTKSASPTTPPVSTARNVGVADTSGEPGIIAGLAEDIIGAVERYAAITGAYRVWDRSHDQVAHIQDVSGSTHAYRMAPLLRHISGVRQKLLQSLMAESRVRWLPDLEDGALNPRALHRIAAARFVKDAPETAASLTRRVFRQKVVTKRLKTAVTLLLDVSHSMNGRKLELARGTAMVLCEALARLNIPVAVWAFSTTHQRKLVRDASQATGISVDTLEKQYRFAPLVLEKFKDFDESFRKISGRFDQLRTHMLTPLGESMLFAARELSHRREPRKVLLVLTDGRPTVGMDNDVSTYNHAHESIRRIERAGVDVMLVGIVERCVLDLHRRAVVVEQLDDLPRTVMNQMRSLLSGDNSRTRIPAGT